MLVTRVSTFSHKSNTMDLPITQEQMDHYNSGALIQNAFPNLSADEREFIMTGITPQEWEDAFGEWKSWLGCQDFR